MPAYLYYYQLTQGEKVIDKIKIFVNCTEAEAEEKWNSFMKNHNYSKTIKFIGVKTYKQE